MKPVCLVIGAGAGIGATVGKRFAKEGYHSVLCRRSDADGLNKSITAIESEGGSATGYIVNAVDPDTIEEHIGHIEKNIGPIEVAVYNLGAQIGNRSLEETSYKAFEMGWRLGTLGLFRLASSVCPLMVERRKGTLLVTSATAAVRGNAGQHSHAAAMGGRRMLCQTLNAELSPKGIHVAHIVVDGAVDAPDTLGKMLGPEKFQEMRENPRKLLKWVKMAGNSPKCASKRRGHVWDCTKRLHINVSCNFLCSMGSCKNDENP